MFLKEIEGKKIKKPWKIWPKYNNYIFHFGLFFN